MRVVEARIEIPMGSRNKYEVDEKTGRINSTVCCIPPFIIRRNMVL